MGNSYRWIMEKVKFASFWSWILKLFFCMFFGTFLFYFAVLSQEVNPPYFSATLSAGQSTSFTLTVNTGPEPVPKIDVVFAIDRTGSMSDEIEVVKDKAVEIMTGIRKKVADSWFGLASFMDYPGYYEYPGYSAQYGDAASGDVPYEVNQAITEDIEAVASAIRGLTLGWGADEPEDYTRVLYELIEGTPESGGVIQWRALSKKIVILFGDAPTHDLDFAGYNFGGDPGRDSIASTEDDLDFETVVRQLRQENITVLAVQGSMYEPMRTYAEATFKGMSIGFNGVEGTNGQYFMLENAEQIPEAIEAMIEEEITQIDCLTLEIPEQYQAWVAFDPQEYTDVRPESTKTFNITITVPEGIEPGEHVFLIQVLGDGALLGSTEVKITIRGGAELGFRPIPHGFRFQNFSTCRSWDMFEQFFGRRNVLHTNGDRVYAAEQFFMQYYSRCTGSCDGFSATSIINFSHSEQPNAGTFAMPYYPRLYEQDLNPAIEDAIAYQQGFWWSYELMAHNRATWIELGNSPLNYYHRLQEYIENGMPVILSFYWRQGTSIVGHSVVPYRIEEEPDEGIGYVYIYDPNFPGGFEHRIRFNLRTNTWADNDYGDTCRGDTHTPFRTLYLVPLSLRLHRGIPPWLQDVIGAYSDIVGSTGPANLLLVDKAGRRLGFTGSEFINEIPEAVYIVPPGSSLGLYYVPQGIDYEVAVYGTAEGTIDFTVFSNEWLAYVKTMVTPSTLDHISLGEGSRSITFSTNDKYKEVSLSIAREFGDTSRIISINSFMSAKDTITVRLTNEGKVICINNGKEKLYDLTLEQRGNGSGRFKRERLTINANATHIIEIKDWNHLDVSRILLHIDEGSDGTVDKTIILQGGFVPPSYFINHGPNPVPPEGCVFWLDLPEDTVEVTLKIFDIDGALLVSVPLDPKADRYPETGRWVPQDAQGRFLGTGLYLYLVEIVHADGTVTYSPVQKMVIKR